jgi:hypothetical protein
MRLNQLSHNHFDNENKNLPALNTLTRLNSTRTNDVLIAKITQKNPIQHRETDFVMKAFYSQYYKYRIG